MVALRARSGARVMRVSAAKYAERYAEYCRDYAWEHDRRASHCLDEPYRTVDDLASIKEAASDRHKWRHYAAQYLDAGQPLVTMNPDGSWRAFRVDDIGI